ncbi:polyketide antibiotic transporter [Saccharopolyspora erythraea]|uniref:ABC transporter permease n=1 Tax=Saccharopolyspora erythraea TaxID=1836 RepID=UPI001BAB600C|nr:polyketide antibiotic transporter [Saccharopolyspora erythraea]QUH03951.1 polyketide antibiotic transporter [Saccharopolyspora erythraea]
MSAVTLRGEPGSAARVPGRAVTGLAVRQIRLSTGVVLAAAAGMSALVAWQYQTTFAGVLNAPVLQALAANPAIRTLFGPPVALDDPGGFTVWRTGTPVAVLVAVWAVLSATRLTRGEEESGHWNLLLAASVRKTALVTRALLVLAAGVVLVGGAVAAALVAAGTSATGAVLHAAGIAGVGLGFAALGGLAAQLLPTRGAASGLSVGVLGAMLLMRMVADGVQALAWLHWVTPFGVVAEVQPYAANRPVPLLVLAVVPLILLFGAVVVASRRDVGAGLLTVAATRPARTWLLSSVGSFAVRRSISPLVGWLLGIASYFLLIGLLTHSLTEFLTDNPRFAELAAAAGFGGLGKATGYAAAMYGLLAIPVGVYAAARIAAVRADEVDRRSVLLLAQPVSRGHLIGVEIAAAVGGVFVLLAGAGVATWAGATAVDADLGLGASLAGVLNIAPIALLCLGAAVLALGWTPRAVLAVGSLPAAGGFLLQVLAQSTGAPRWVGQLSPFAHIASVPAAPANWAGAAGLSATACGLVIVGVIGYARRDLAT